MGFWKKPVGWLTRHAHGTIAAGATLLGLVLFVYSGIGQNHKAVFAFLQDIEQRSLDLRFALRGSREPDPNIVIVDIDEKTLQKIGSYPLPRSNYALLIRRLKQDGASVIAFDVTFPLPESNEALAMLNTLGAEFSKKASRAQQQEIDTLQQQVDVDRQFADALKDAGNVVLGHLFLDAGRAKYADSNTSDAYFDVIWAKAFPQVFKTKSGKGQFDITTAWIQAGGTEEKGVEPNLPAFADAAASYGFFNISPDDDGTLRRALLLTYYLHNDEGLFFPSLDVEVLQQYEKIPDQQIAAYMSADGLDHILVGSHSFRPRQDGKALINYVGPYNSYPHYSMVDVIDGGFPAQAFKNKVVLVGATALGIGDLRNTPYQQQSSTYMGVEVHANIIDNLLHSDEPHRTFLVRGSRQEMVDIAVIVLFGIGLSLWFGRCKPFTATLTAVIVLAAFVAFVYFAFVRWGHWYSIVVPATTLIISYVSATSFRVVFEEREARRIRKTFSQYLSPAVISLMEKDPEKYIRPGGEIQDLTIMFSDIRDFTAISESMSPDDLVRLLNEYFTAMTDILLDNYGTLDKYIGDAVMAFWGSPYPIPKHAYYACTTALKMVARLAELNHNWSAHGLPEISIGIGINGGPVNVGNIGSEKRLSWTVMGDNVNLASRLEGMTKQYHIQTIISETIYREVKHQFIAREVDKIRVKGKKEPTTIYELISPVPAAAECEALVTPYNQALECYRGHKWKEAAGRFGEILAIYPSDGPTQILLQRCLEFVDQAPPEDWDGIYVVKEK